MTGAVFARNPYSMEFGERVAFFGVSESEHTVTGDRAEFLGRNGTVAAPAAMTRVRLSGQGRGGIGPLRRHPGYFRTGRESGTRNCFRARRGTRGGRRRELVGACHGIAPAREALDAVWHYWSHTLGAVNVETPDPSVNVLANGWLLYQILAGRLWGRSGFYQSGGAFGFRDQLQDVMALIHAEPGLIRQHLLLCASHQFREGDVQHWWHPPMNRGVRTHCSDDFLWLALATCRYVSSTGDIGVLDEIVPFLEGRPLSAEDESYYDLPVRSEETASLLRALCPCDSQRIAIWRTRAPAHALRRLERRNESGRQGRKGRKRVAGILPVRGHSQFAELARIHADAPFQERCMAEVAFLRENIEKHAWDGDWYLRAYFDDGSPLGSESNPECKIDSIPQSWSVLSGAGDVQRSRLAMEAVDQRLVRRDRGLIQLLDPPFDHSALNPGYIKGYVPGVRENGGQYTHAAIWTVMAFAALGDSARAWELFAMINPTHHSSSPDQIAKYKVEPYVVAADVYACAPHTGRGGWTWYTGSAGWMYRLVTESLLGLRLEGTQLRIEPCVPAAWDGFKIHYRYRETLYHISVLPKSAEPSVTLDGVVQPDMAIPLVDDSREHMVQVKP